MRGRFKQYWCGAKEFQSPSLRHPVTQKARASGIPVHFGRDDNLCKQSTTYATNVSGGLQEGDGLDSGDFEALAAADIFAGDHVVAADHIGLRLGEAGAVALIGVAGQSTLLAADEPAQFVVASLSAVGAGEHVVALLGALVKEIAFFHWFFPLSVLL